MARTLSPAELTYQSFRHSQGSMGPQIRIFNYMEHTFGIKPDLHLDSNEMRRYVSYICQPDDKKHIGHTQDKAAGATIGAFKSLRAYVKNDRLPSPAKTIQKLTFQVLYQEARILDPQVEWSSISTPRKYTERLKARVESGKSSFLYYFGRDGRSTGFDEFDQMYSDIWQMVEVISTWPVESTYYQHYDTHRMNVVDAELGILGHLALGEYQQ